jgi:23S rRNA pseudouridine1911/1915/1917 synthase
MKNIQILYEDNHLIVINKKAGDIVQVDKTGDESLEKSIKSYIKEKYTKPGEVFLGVTHRLDRPTSGIVIFAKTTKALTRINKMLNEKSIQKTYLAIVDQMPKKNEDTLMHYIQRNQVQNKSYAFDKEVPDSKLAILKYRFLAKSDRFILLEIDLQTGRHHQIRAQLVKIGCRIKGDLKYGFPRSNPDGGICLHAYKVRFIHPVNNQEMIIKAPLPDDKLWLFFSEICKKLL